MQRRHLLHSVGGLETKAMTMFVHAWTVVGAPDSDQLLKDMLLWPTSLTLLHPNHPGKLKDSLIAWCIPTLSFSMVCERKGYMESLRPWMESECRTTGRASSHHKGS